MSEVIIVDSDTNKTIEEEKLLKLKKDLSLYLKQMLINMVVI